MSDLRTAAQQALEALEEYQYRGAPFLACDGAADALRAALAQQDEPVAWLQPKTVDGYSRPDLGYETCSKDDYGAFPVYRASPKAEPEQEPVAWIQPDHLQKARIAPFLCRVEPTQRCADFVPFWTAPPQRKPLTQEEIDRICASLGFAAISPAEIVRAVERAHGIGETK